jgi:hypothetical protein
MKNGSCPLVGVGPAGSMGQIRAPSGAALLSRNPMTVKMIPVTHSFQVPFKLTPPIFDPL